MITFSLLFGALIEIAEKGDFGCDRVADVNGSFTNSSIVTVANETIDCYLRDSSWEVNSQHPFFPICGDPISPICQKIMLFCQKETARKGNKTGNHTQTSEKHKREQT